MRRRPVGRTIIDICSISPSSQAFATARSGASYPSLHLVQRQRHQTGAEKNRRRKSFVEEQDRKRDGNWDWINMTRDALRQVLGFFIGEPPVNPFDPAAAPATGPP